MKINSRRSNANFFVATFGVLLLLAVCLRTVAQTNTFPASGNVGVGTTSPASVLTVQTTGIDSGGDKYLRIKSTNSYSGLLLDPGQAGDAGWLVLGGYPNAGDFTIREYGVANYFTIKKTTGYIGIGTTSPTHPLTVRAASGTFGILLNNNAETYALSYLGPRGSSGNALSQGFFQVSNLGTATVVLDSAGSSYFTGGNVGIGTSTPAYKLDVTDNNANVGGFQVTNNTNGPTAQLQTRLVNNAGSLAYYGLTSTGYTYAPILSNRAFFGSSGVDTVIWTQNANNIIFATNGITTAAERMRIDSSGNVGIGMSPDAQYRLDVNGSIRVSGNIAAKYQDVAEWVESSEQLSAATVVVLDQTKSNQVVASSHAYDTRVAGVISAQPGITLGEQGDSKVLVATTGRVKVRVDATNGPIQVGDLLVTSDIAGVAKKSEPLLLGGVPIHRPGTLIGKALEPLAGSRGEILVLLSLQ